MNSMNVSRMRKPIFVAIRLRPSLMNFLVTKANYAIITSTVRWHHKAYRRFLINLKLMKMS